MKGSKDIRELIRLFVPPIAVDIANKVLNREEPHRGVVGGMWDEIGKLQFEFMVKQGLKSEHKFLDIGCGSLRGGSISSNFLMKRTISALTRRNGF